MPCSDFVAQSGSSRENSSIHHLLVARAENSPNAVAITAPGRIPLSYCRLRMFVEDTVRTLNAMGVGRNDRVAIVLPNGPEMAVASIAVAAGATAEPLNPSYRANEFAFYLSHLKAKALIVRSGIESPARTVAQALGISIIELSPLLEAEAGIFTVKGEVASPPAQDSFAQPDDVAFVLLTAGTTSRSKDVPLTQRSVCNSALNIRAVLKLESSDRCLNVMPLFHVHGLIGAALSSLAGGGSLLCMPFFYPPKFFEWMEEFRPTWYTAVPAMHQAILASAVFYRETISRYRLRFVRSSSSPLSFRVMADLESVFNAPVVDSYGMTEASHQITSNPLPPGKRKAGSVGQAAGPEIAIMDEEGSLVPSSQIGEIVIRGLHVMQGYENNKTAHSSDFTNRWFRTGDQGFLDAEGYLFITGRLTEIINRGGEKISPSEVDGVLLDHPAIGQAVTFAVPHPKLGHDVAAAVVLRQNASATATEIREFAAGYLADFKVPRRVVIVDQLPTHAMGKLQRIGLAEQFGLETSD